MTKFANLADFQFKQTTSYPYLKDIRANLSKYNKIINFNIEIKYAFNAE